MVPPHQIRAEFDADTIVVYQAYGADIAAPAVRSQTFVSPFKMSRMTWIKPSFLWMMYRCGWARKEGQERVLRIRLIRAGFEEALSQACLSSAQEQGVPADEWSAYKARYPVRVQWDPERSVTLEPLLHRSIQIGLSGAAVRAYVKDWIVGIDDVTALVRQIGERVEGGALGEAESLLPKERPYPTCEPWHTRLMLTDAK